LSHEFDVAGIVQVKDEELATDLRLQKQLLLTVTMLTLTWLRQLSN